MVISDIENLLLNKSNTDVIMKFIEHFKTFQNLLNQGNEFNIGIFFY